MNTSIPRTGDSVLHGSTGEEWLVAWVEGDELAWFGWPDGTAKLSDCTVIQRCTNAEHTDIVKKVSNSGDSRAYKVARLYSAALAGSS